MTQRPAFRVEDVKRPRFYAQHRDAILEAIGQGLVLLEDAEVPPGAELVTRETPTFTRAQVMDQKFYEANREAILEALSEGGIK